MLVLQWLAGRHWTRVAAALALVVIVATPVVWASGLGARLPEALGPYLDERTGSRFPIFPFSAFVLAGTLAGATLGRAEPGVRHRRALVAGVGLLAPARSSPGRSPGASSTGGRRPPTCWCGSAACSC